MSAFQILSNCLVSVVSSDTMIEKIMLQITSWGRFNNNLVTSFLKLLYRNICQYDIAK